MNSNTEELVNQVVRGLATAAPTQGLEERVLANIRSREASSPTWLDTLRWLMRSASLTWAFAAPAAVAVAAAATVLLHHHSRPTSPTQQIDSAKPAAASISTELPNISPMVHEAAVKQATTKARPAIAHIHPQSEAPANDYDKLAMEEWRAPSRPAPELPLTHEERLLQNYARRGETEELAALTPAFRAAEHAREQNEFQQFFTKPTHGENQE